MKTVFNLVCTGLLLLSACAMAEEDPSQKQAEECLMCHGGSFEALAAKTKDWKDEFGDQIQPHVYIDGKAAKAHEGRKVLPDCVGCHGKHPVPKPADYKMKEPTLSTCYGCHHTENFTRCSTSGCHGK